MREEQQLLSLVDERDTAAVDLLLATTRSKFEAECQPGKWSAIKSGILCCIVHFILLVESGAYERRSRRFAAHKLLVEYNRVVTIYEHCCTPCIVQIVITLFFAVLEKFSLTSMFPSW